MSDRPRHFFNRSEKEKHDSSPIETLTELIFALNRKIAELSLAQDQTNKRLDALTLWLTQNIQQMQTPQPPHQQKTPSKPPYFVPRNAAEVGGLVALVVLALVVLAVALSK